MRWKANTLVFTSPNGREPKPGELLLNVIWHNWFTQINGKQAAWGCQVRLSVDPVRVFSHPGTSALPGDKLAPGVAYIAISNNHPGNREANGVWQMVNSVAGVHVKNSIVVALILLLSACGGSGGGNTKSSSSAGLSSVASSMISSSLAQSSSSSSSFSSANSSSTASTNVVFDDFSYSMTSEMEANGWIVRSGSGGPGVSGASWSKELVTFFEDPENENNSLMKMKASTQGSGNTTTQSQVTYEGNHLRGTYAARVYFNNSPVSGPDGDQLVETFYTITPLAFDMDPDYSEIDFEYLPNGGWGQSQPTMFLTTWETYKPEPWTVENISETLTSDYSGWHTFVAQVDHNSVRYYIDGVLEATHTGNVYPETNMSLNFNIWFIQGGLITSTTERSYEQDVDWMYFADQEILSPTDVEARVEALRAQDISYLDTVN